MDIKKDLLLPHIQEADLIGFFQANYFPSTKWHVFLGPFSAFMTRVCYVAVTNQGIHFHKLTMLGKPDTYEFFNFSSIRAIKIGKGSLYSPVQFLFTNGDTLLLQAQQVSFGKSVALDDQTRDFLLAKYPQQ